MNTDTLLQAINEREKALQDYKDLQEKNFKILDAKLQEYRDAIKPLLDQIPNNTISFRGGSAFGDASVAIEFGYDTQIFIVWENNDFKYNKRVVKYGEDHGGDNEGAYYDSEVISEKEFNDLFIGWMCEAIRRKKDIDEKRALRNAEDLTIQKFTVTRHPPPVTKSFWQQLRDLFVSEN